MASKSPAKNLGPAIRQSAAFVTVLFLIEAMDYFLTVTSHSTGSVLDVFGIIPRSVLGLPGIVFSPLLHASPAHLLANAVPLFILLTLLFWDRHYYPVLTLTLIWLGSGLGTWLIGRSHTVHIGASGLIYGLVTYLIVAGWLMKRWQSALVAIGVFLIYGGIFYGVLPHNGLISWEGHLSGAIAGFWVARSNHE